MSSRPDQMDQKVQSDLSPFRVYSTDDWSRFRRDAEIRMSESDLRRLQSLNDRVSMAEVQDVYLPIARLIQLYITAYRSLHNATEGFFRTDNAPVPFIIGIAGSVAVGKSTAARLLQAILAQLKPDFKVDLITTDGFLYPNAVLEKEGLMQKKGFPESYDRPALLKFLSDIKAGQPNVQAPVYSHFEYDILPYNFMSIDRPDILIVEGINVLQPGRLPKDGQEVPFVSDFFDFSVYVDADQDAIARWYIERFMTLRETAFRDPNSYFHRYSRIDDDEAYKVGIDIWKKINLKNLKKNILPTRQRADLILRKDTNHRIESIALRKV